MKTSTTCYYTAVAMAFFAMFADNIPGAIFSCVMAIFTLLGAIWNEKTGN